MYTSTATNDKVSLIEFYLIDSWKTGDYYFFNLRFSITSVNI